MTAAPVLDAVPREVRRQGTDSVVVTWSDGHLSLFPNRYLRDNCPCAYCERMQPRYSLPVRSDDGIHPAQITAIGRYALGIQWSDGHDSGIYSYATLRALCPCDECAPAGAS